MLLMCKKMCIGVDLMFPLIYAGPILGGEGEPEAVKELRLPSFNSLPVTPTTIVNKEVTGGVEP